ncbi:MAG: hypothetical protein ACLGH3_01255 [Actinomycetota bacterium]
MGSIRDDTIGSFNTFVDDLKNQQGRTLLTLVQFDTEGIETIYDSIPIQEATPLTRETYIPRGGTPLLDAIGHTLASMETKLSSTRSTSSGSHGVLQRSTRPEARMSEPPVGRCLLRRCVGAARWQASTNSSSKRIAAR